ncbi:MAG: hypothetical protein J7J86_07785 [Bacteroidales bacterium]|nr:hypothetical protein [Bacteroidales bacterium]
MNKRISIFRLGTYKLKIIGFIFLTLSIAFFILKKIDIISFLPNWLVNWLIVVSLTLINFSKEKIENKTIEIIRLQSLYLSSLSVIALIISFEFVSGIFHLTEGLQSIIVAFIFNMVFLVTYQFYKFTTKRVDNVEKNQTVTLNMTIGSYLVWGLITAIAIASIFILF